MADDFDALSSLAFSSLFDGLVPGRDNRGFIGVPGVLEGVRGRCPSLPSPERETITEQARRKVEDPGEVRSDRRSQNVVSGRRGWG